MTSFDAYDVIGEKSPLAASEKLSGNPGLDNNLGTVSKLLLFFSPKYWLDNLNGLNGQPFLNFVLVIYRPVRLSSQYLGEKNSNNLEMVPYTPSYFLACCLYKTWLTEHLNDDN